MSMEDHCTGNITMWYNLRRRNPWGATIHDDVEAFNAMCAAEREEKRKMKEQYSAQLKEQIEANAAAKRRAKELRLAEGEKIIHDAQEQLEAQRREKLEATLQSQSARKVPNPPPSLTQQKREQYEAFKQHLEEKQRMEEEEAAALQESRERSKELSATLRQLSVQARQDRKLAKAARLEEERKLLQQWDESLVRQDYQSFLRQHQKILPDIDPHPAVKRPLTEIHAQEREAMDSQRRQVEESEKARLQQKKEVQAKYRSDLLRQMEERKSARLSSTQRGVALRQHLEDMAKTSTLSARSESVRRQERTAGYAEELKRQMDERCLRDADEVVYPLKATELTPAPPLPCSPGRTRPLSSRRTK